MEKLRDSKYVCNRLGISDSTLTRWYEDDESGLLRPVQKKRRGKRLWSESNLLLWIERNLSTAQPKIVPPETPAKIEKRFKSACANLKELGVKIEPAK
jgi:predicted DNA-binding transcriptional regulator AlpA